MCKSLKDSKRSTARIRMTEIEKCKILFFFFLQEWRDIRTLTLLVRVQFCATALKTCWAVYTKVEF